LIDDSQGYSYTTSSGCVSNLALGQAAAGGGFQCSLHDSFVFKDSDGYNNDYFFGIVKVPSSNSEAPSPCYSRMRNAMEAIGNYYTSQTKAEAKTNAVLNGIFHEIAEIVMSPYPGHAWSVKLKLGSAADRIAEAADICQTVFLNTDGSKQLGRYWIQSIYNPESKQCEV